MTDDYVERMADLRGVATDQAASGSYALQARVLDAAELALTARQLEIARAHLGGATQVEIAARLGISQAAVSQALYGSLRRGRRIGGIVRKLQQVIKTDAEPDVLDEPVEVRPALAEWFVPAISPPSPVLFVALAVLIVFAELADASGRLAYGDALERLPRAVLDSAMPTLRYGGWIESDGIVIRVLKTPAGPHAR